MKSTQKYNLLIKVPIKKLPVHKLKGIMLSDSQMVNFYSNVLNWSRAPRLCEKMH